MKVNKTILIGIAFIVLAGIIFTIDFLNPIIRPITYLFLMGSSKGKDIMFFGLLGLFLVASQLINRDIDHKKFLKISIVIGSVLLTLGILLEIIFRLQMGIGLNTVFCSMSNTMSSTSILHTHLLKSILGEVLTKLMGPFIQSDINTGVGLYSYLPNFGFLIILLLPVLFITLILSIPKKLWITNILTAFFSSCLIIGAIDGGLFGTPAMAGICGLFVIYRNGYYFNNILGTIFNDKNLVEINELTPPSYGKEVLYTTKYMLNRFLPYIVIGVILLLRFTVAFAGAEPDYYTVEIENMDDEVDFGNITIEKIDNETYKSPSTYNELELINALKVPLNNSCEYYTVSWNIYSYFRIA